MGTSALPVPPNPLLGRERELEELGELLRRGDARLLTLTGAGGSGKTRLALEAARRSAAQFANGAVLVELAPVRDPNLLVPTIAQAIGVRESTGESLEALIDAIRAQELLLLVDNAEHLRDATPCFAQLVAQVPRLALLVTSRVVLHLSGERVYPVHPLRLEAAVELFLARAHEADAGFQVNAVSIATVERICERPDGLPLAVELAATRVRSLSLDELHLRLEARLPLLTGGPRDLPARQQTLRATLAWSIDLLDEQERRLFARLSVFRGGFTLAAAEAVCDAELDTLASLLDNSLLHRVIGGGREGRYSMLETVREFALEQLDAYGSAEALRRRHAERMLEVARAAHLGDTDTQSDLAAGTAERENLRAALDWAEENDPELGLELAVALQNLWNASGPEEGMRRFERLLERAPSTSPQLRAAALRVYGGTADLSGFHAAAERLTEESLRLYEQLGDEWGIAMVEHMLAVSAWRSRDWQRMRELTEHSLELARGRFPFIETTNYWLLGQLALADGDLDQATRLTQASADGADELGWSWWKSGQLHELLALALQRGDLKEAEQQGRAALLLEREHENRLWALYTIAGLAQAALARGDLDRAGPLGRSRKGGPAPSEVDRRAQPTRRPAA
jgi:predicted ATPase